MVEQPVEQQRFAGWIEQLPGLFIALGNGTPEEFQARVLIDRQTLPIPRLLEHKLLRKDSGRSGSEIDVMRHCGQGFWLPGCWWLLVAGRARWTSAVCWRQFPVFLGDRIHGHSRPPSSREVV
jgi:hypothetical protein